METGRWQVFTDSFKPLTEGKPIWFTEIGGMVCKSNFGYMPNGGTDSSLLPAALSFANSKAANLVNYSDSKVARTYYYALGESNNGEVRCPGFDSTLLGGSAVPRPAYKTVFPNAIYPPPSTSSAANLFMLYNSTVHGKVEAHILSRASNYTAYLGNYVTAQSVFADSQTDWAVENANGDSFEDLFLIFSNPSTGKVEVHILNGATNYTSYLGNYATPQGTFPDDRVEWGVRD